MQLSIETLLGVALLLPQALALLRVPVGPGNDYRRLAKKGYFETDTTLQTYIIPGTDFYFGSQHEKVFVSFDTGSYTTYVQDSSISDNGFDGNDSTTLTKLGTSYQVDYADGTSFKGEWVSDDVAFDSEYSHTANLTFGLVTDAADSTNIVGLGYYPDSSDPTFIDTIYNDQVISRKVFSVYQDSVSDGEFTFGGIDTAKFSGDLTAVPVIDAQSWSVKVFDFYHGCETLTNGNSYQILIDSGSSTGLYLPDDVYYKLINKLEAQYESTLEGYIFDCLKAESLTIDFGGKQIEIPTSSFVQAVTGTDYCTVNWRLSPEGAFQLGWTFFDNFYFVFDADNKEILIGEPNKGTTDESIVEVTGDVPSSVQAPSYSQTALVSTNSIDYTTASTVSIFASSSSLGDYYNGATGYTTCSASSSSSSSSSSASSSSSSISSSILSSSVVSSSSIEASSAPSSSAISSVEPSSSVISSVEPSSSSVAFVSSSAPYVSATSSGLSSTVSSSEAESSIPVVFSSAPVSSVEESSAPVSFPTVSASSAVSSVPSPSSALSSSFSGYFNSSSSAVSSSQASSALPSSIATPSINGSFINGVPVWDCEIPGALGPWSEVEISSANGGEFSYDTIELYVENSLVSPSVYQKNQNSFQYNYDGEVSDNEVLKAHIVGGSFAGQSATIEVIITIIDQNGAKLVKRATQSFTLTSTITASATSSSVSSAVSVSSSASTTAASATSSSGSAAGSDSSVATSGAGDLSTSTATVDNQQTTVATITSCSNNVCTEQPTTVLVQTVTQTIGNIIKVYTTYCPLSTDSTTESVPVTAATTTPVVPASTTSIVNEASSTPVQGSASSSDVETYTTEYVYVTSTLPNGEVTTVQSAVPSVEVESVTPVPESATGFASVSPQLIPTSTEGDSTLYVTALVTVTQSSSSSSVAGSSIPVLLTQGVSSNGTNTQTPVQVSQYEGSAGRLATGLLSALPIALMFF